MEYYKGAKSLDLGPNTPIASASSAAEYDSMGGPMTMV